MIRITQLKLPITHTEEQLHRKIAKILRLGNQPFTYEIRKQSLDARHKEEKKFVYTVDIKLDNESRVLKKVHNKNIMLTSEKKYHFPSSGSETLSHRPVVIGSGPAGLFCAWYLAKAGYCPLVLERGEEADKRQETVENFWKNGILDPDSNVQFGEGGKRYFWKRKGGSFPICGGRSSFRDPLPAKASSWHRSACRYRSVYASSD